MRMVHLARRLRAADPGDERGSSIVVVIAYLAMGFTIAAVIASSCIFLIVQNTRAQASVQSFSAAEAGRDAVVAALEIAPESCPETATYRDDPGDSTDPQFQVQLFTSAAETAPLTADGLAQGCPGDSARWVVLRSTGTAPNGAVSIIEAVYPWSRFRSQVAGDALGYMDSSYSASFSSISGDTIVKHGDLNCNWDTKFKGNVFVLEGRVNVGINLGSLTGTPSCEIEGDLFVGGNITMADPVWLIAWFYGRLQVGGQIKVTGDITASGRVESGTIAARPYRDIVAGGRILATGSQGRVTSFNGGAIMAVGDIEAASSTTISSAAALRTNASLVANGTVTAAGGIAATGSITGNGAVTSANGSISAGGSIAGSGARSANGGDLTAVLDIAGSGARSAKGSVLAGRDISTTGTVTATGGDIQAGGTISGGARTAGRAVLAAGDISSTGTVTAGGGNLHAGGVISGGARSASGAVLARGDITAGTLSAGTDIRTNGSITGTADRTANGAISAGGSIAGSGTVQARSGGILTGGDITGSGPRIAGTSASAPVGSIAARGRIESSGGTTAVNLTALGAIKVDGSCRVSGTVHAAGPLSFDDTVGSQAAGWNAPTCSVGVAFWSSSTTRSTLGSYTAPAKNKSNGTFPNTRIPNADGIRVPAGWNPTASNRFMTGAGGVPGTAGTGSNPGAPSVPSPPVVDLPSLSPVAAPTPFTMVLNEDLLNGTWESFDDLQLRTTWVDLGSYTMWTGYTVLPPLTGAQCSGSWFNPGGYLSTILSSPGEVTIGGTVVARAKERVVIDATACPGTISMAWSSFNLARDAVLLVNSASFNLAPFRATNLAAGETRQLFVIQVDPDNKHYPPAWGGQPEPIPHCQGRPRVSMTGTGWGSLAWDERVSVLLYSPCGIDGSIAKAWSGHIYVHNDTVTQDVLSTMVCKPMRISGVVDLPCDINEVSSLGSMNVNAWRLGQRVSQTER